ncbi:MAG TPA: hypothetical protein VE913_09770 [Longimicrobium sp.]|nr:hypothetical protein [Longimicrobium sp.]
MERIRHAAGEPECFALIPRGTLILPPIAVARAAAAPEVAR